MTTLTDPRVAGVLDRLLAEAHLYPDLLRLLEPDLAKGALIAADNADSPGHRDFIAKNPDFVSVTVDGRVDVSLWVG